MGFLDKGLMDSGARKERVRKEREPEGAGCGLLIRPLTTRRPRGEENEMRPRRLP